MRTLLDDVLDEEYKLFLWRLRICLLDAYGTQKKAAEAIGIDPANLSKYLTGVVDCNSKLLFRMISLAHMVVIKNHVI